jgi:hypothetical protein
MTRSWRLCTRSSERSDCMSALGQKRTCAVQTVMSALPSKTDIRRALLTGTYKPSLAPAHHHHVGNFGMSTCGSVNTIQIAANQTATSTITTAPTITLPHMGWDHSASWLLAHGCQRRERIGVKARDARAGHPAGVFHFIRSTFQLFIPLVPEFFAPTRARP